MSFIPSLGNSSVPVSVPVPVSGSESSDPDFWASIPWSGYAGWVVAIADRSVVALYRRACHEEAEGKVNALSKCEDIKVFLKRNNIHLEKDKLPDLQLD